MSKRVENGRFTEGKYRVLTSGATAYCEYRQDALTDRCGSPRDDYGNVNWNYNAVMTYRDSYGGAFDGENGNYWCVDHIPRDCPPDLRRKASEPKN